MLLNLTLVILAFIYGVILLRENDGKLSNFLAIVLLAVSSLGLLAIVAMELSKQKGIDANESIRLDTES